MGEWFRPIGASVLLGAGWQSTADGGFQLSRSASSTCLSRYDSIQCALTGASQPRETIEAVRDRNGIPVKYDDEVDGHTIKAMNLLDLWLDSDHGATPSAEAPSR
jgi:hypothetical protein